MTLLSPVRWAQVGHTLIFWSSAFTFALRKEITSTVELQTNLCEAWSCIITECSLTRAFSWLKVVTTGNWDANTKALSSRRMWLWYNREGWFEALKTVCIVYVCSAYRGWPPQSRVWVDQSQLYISPSCGDLESRAARSTADKTARTTLLLPHFFSWLWLFDKSKPFSPSVLIPSSCR